MTQRTQTQILAEVRAAEQALIATLPLDPADTPEVTRLVFDATQREAFTGLNAAMARLVQASAEVSAALDMPSGPIRLAASIAAGAAVIVAADDCTAAIADISQRIPYTSRAGHTQAQARLVAPVETLAKLAEFVDDLGARVGFDKTKPIAAAVWPKRIAESPFARAVSEAVAEHNDRIFNPNPNR